MSIQKLSGLSVLCLFVSGCMTAIPPVEVTRFHNAAESQISLGTVAIKTPEEAEQTLEQGVYSAAVMRELQRVGYGDAGSLPETSDYVARISISQSRINASGGRSPISVGVGGTTGGYGSGLGLGIGFNLGGRRKDKIATELSVRISRRSDGQSIWEGRSSVEVKDGSPASQPGLAAAKLAEALFRDFPGESGMTIKVP